MIVVYFSSSSGYTKKFVENLPFESIQIPASLKEASSLKMEQEFVLVSPTYGGGSLSRKEKTYVPKQVDAFIKANYNHKLLVGTVGSGQANFGHTWYCKAPKDLSIRYNVPYLGGFEVTGLPGEKEKITEAIKKVGRGLPSVESSIEYNEYNAKLNTWSYDEDGNKFIDFDVDKEAVRQYHLQVINNQTKFFPSLEDKLNYLFENDYYEKEPFEKFTFDELKSLYKRAYKYKHRFSSTLGAMKFYTSYALKSNDGKVILERFEDRVVANAVLLSRGYLGLAEEFVDEIISGRLQPATPTFSNACKKRSGNLVSCYLVSSSEDSMASVSRIVHSALQLSKSGGGVGIDLTSMRCAGDPIKGVENQSTGIIPISKLLDDAFSYSNQLGQRSGAGVVYLSIHHPDFLSLLDAKRANADEKIRLKTLSIGAVVTDVAFELAKSNDVIYQFSPYDVEREYGKVMSYVDIDAEYENMVNNPRIRKVSKVPARKLFTKIAQTQSESGYPYLMFSAQVDRNNPITEGRAVMSNLCVSGDTRLATTNGLCKAEDLFKNGTEFCVVSDNRVLNGDVDDFSTSVKKSTKMIKTADNVETFKVTTSEGFSLSATSWHKFFVKDGEKIAEKRLNELEPGDKLLVQPSVGVFGNIHKPELAYLAGAICADGVFFTAMSVAGEPLVRTRMDFFGDKKSAMSKYTKMAHAVLKGREDLCERQATTEPEPTKDKYSDKYSISSAPLARLFVENGYYPDDNKLSVPEFIFYGDKDTQKSYLSGVFSFDGCVVASKSGSLSVELVSISRKLLEDLQIILSNFGIYSRIYKANPCKYQLMPNGNGGNSEYLRKQTWSLRVVGKRDVPLFIESVELREEQLYKYNSYISSRDMTKSYKTHRFTATVQSIDFDCFQDVYDVFVEDGHSVIFNGISTHNCSEILQSQTPSKVREDGTYEEVGRDVSCNLASLNIKKAMNGKNLAKTVEVAVRGLTAVADLTDIDAVPTVRKANRDFRSVGLGQFSLHEFFLDEGISYAEKRTPENEGELRGASEEAKSFTNVYFSVVTYHALMTSNLIAIERGKTFEGFENSKYADSSYLIEKYTPEDMRVPIESVKHIFDKYNVHLPTLEEWKELAVSIEKHGLYNAYLQAVPPTGSISYINGGTSSIHPAVTVIEPRKEGTVGKVYYPTPGVTNENIDEFEDAYEVGPKAVIDVYAQAQKHVDQALSMTLFYKETDTTRTYNKMYNYAHKNGIKTIYYARVRSTDVSGTSVEECVSCTL